MYLLKYQLASAADHAKDSGDPEWKESYDHQTTVLIEQTNEHSRSSKLLALITQQIRSLRAHRTQLDEKDFRTLRETFESNFDKPAEIRKATNGLIAQYRDTGQTWRANNLVRIAEMLIDERGPHFNLAYVTQDVINDAAHELSLWKGQKLMDFELVHNLEKLAKDAIEEDGLKHFNFVVDAHSYGFKIAQ
jgi:hypothetical protein